MVRVACLAALSLSLALGGCSSPAQPLPAVAAATTATAPARPTSQPVRLWQDASIFGLVGRMISTAQRRLYVEVYEIGRADLVRELGAAEARGVAVRVITDPTVAASRASADSLDGLGVPERMYPIDDSRHQIDHVKLLVADSSAAVGGMNWGRHSDRNHDYVLETHVSADVDRMSRVFEQDWNLAGGRPAPLGRSLGDVAQTAPGSEIRSMLEGALGRARSRVLAEVYTLTDPEVIRELVRARGRSAVVRVLLDPNQAYNLHGFAVLRAGGVDVRWYPIPRDALLHAKIGLFDDTLVLGSANWTWSGLEVNHELDVATTDPDAVALYGSRFNSDWSRSSGG